MPGSETLLDGDGDERLVEVRGNTESSQQSEGAVLTCGRVILCDEWVIPE
jgi:hypothetical protein